MTNSTRLKLSTLIGLFSVIGLSILFYLMLPQIAEEVTRREQEKELEVVASSYLEDIVALAKDTRSTLNHLKLDSDILKLATKNADDVHALANTLNLAKQLCNTYSLDNLILMDNTGVLRSLYPAAARIGLRDAAMLDLAKTAVIKPVFIKPYKKLAKTADEDIEKQALFELALSSSVDGGKFWIVATINITKEHLEILGERRNVEVSLLQDKTKSHENAKLVVINDNNKDRLLTIALNPANQGRTIIRQLLVRNIVMLALPWVLLFSFLLIWIGWPKTDMKEND